MKNTIILYVCLLALAVGGWYVISGMLAPVKSHDDAVLEYMIEVNGAFDTVLEVLKDHDSRLDALEADKQKQIVHY